MYVKTSDFFYPVCCEEINQHLFPKTCIDIFYHYTPFCFIKFHTLNSAYLFTTQFQLLTTLKKEAF